MNKKVLTYLTALYMKISLLIAAFIKSSQFDMIRVRLLGLHMALTTKAKSGPLRFLHSFYVSIHLAPASRSGSLQQGLGPAMFIVGIAVFLAIIGLISALSILPTGASAGLISAATQIITFLSIIGIGIAVALLNRALGMATGGRSTR